MARRPADRHARRQQIAWNRETCQRARHCFFSDRSPV